MLYVYIAPHYSKIVRVRSIFYLERNQSKERNKISASLSPQGATYNNDKSESHLL